MLSKIRARASTRLNELYTPHAAQTTGGARRVREVVGPDKNKLLSNKVFLFHGSAFCIHRRNWRTIRSPWTFPAVSTLSHREKPRRSREPSSSLAERQQQRNDSGTTASIRRKPCGTGGRYTRYQGFAHAGSSAPPQSARIILFCYTPHTRPSAASSATTALTINFTNHRVLSQRSLIYPYTVAERVRPPFCASL